MMGKRIWHTQDIGQENHDWQAFIGFAPWKPAQVVCLACGAIEFLDRIQIGNNSSICPVRQLISEVHES